MTLSRICLIERRVLDRQPVGQLHQHLGRAGLAAVQAAHQVIDRLGLRDDLACACASVSVRGSASCAEIAAVAIEVLDRVLGGDRR